jgi:hypothetical protein
MIEFDVFILNKSLINQEEMYHVQTFYHLPFVFFHLLSPKPHGPSIPGIQF